MIPIQSKLQKDQIVIILAVLRRLCACATQFRTPKKKTSQHWRASHTDSDVFNHYAKRLVKGKFEFEFSLAIIEATKKSKVYSKYHKIIAKNRSAVNLQ